MWACKSRPYGAQKAPVSETPEGRSIVVLAKQGCGLRGRAVTDVDFVPFTAQTRISSVNMPDSRQIRKVDLPAARVARWATPRPSVRGARRHRRQAILPRPLTGHPYRTCNSTRKQYVPDMLRTGGISCRGICVRSPTETPTSASCSPMVS